MHYFYLQVKEVIMAYFVLMSQGKATDEVSTKPSTPPEVVYFMQLLYGTLLLKLTQGPKQCFLSEFQSFSFLFLSLWQCRLRFYIATSEDITTILCGLKQELDRRCEQLMASKFGEKCDFDVVDALEKLEKLEIVTKVSLITWCLIST